MGRNLDWEGIYNARDLGGFPTVEGGITRRGAVVRSDSPDQLTSSGWSALQSHGVRTVVDLRGREERERRGYDLPEGIAGVQVALEEDLDEDPEFRHWATTGLLATPLYYQTFLERWPERCAAVVAAVAEADDGGVLVHCQMGRDRTGIAAILLLGLVGVSAEEVAADHVLSQSRLRKYGGMLGYEDDSLWVEALLYGQKTTAHEAVAELAGSLDVGSYLRAAGLGEATLSGLRSRLLA